MKISIVMATYNGYKYLSKQLDSILNQTLPPDEIVIVDDCSTDDYKTLALLDKYEQKYKSIKLIKNKINLGWQANFINGVKCSTGEVIFFADQDDIWESDKIEKMLAVFNSVQNAKAIVSNYSFIDETGNKIRKRKEYTQCTNKVKKVSFNSHFVETNRLGCTLCIDTVYAKKYIDLWVERFPHDQFFELLTEITENLYLLEIPLIRHRIHSNNTDVMHIFDSNVRANTQRTINRQINILLDNQARFGIYENKISSIREYLKYGQEREAMLRSNSITGWLMLVRYLEFYPSIKMYFGDLKSIIKEIL